MSKENSRNGDLSINNDLKIREINSQMNTPSKANQQEYIIKMDGSYYLENPLTKSTDMKSHNNDSHKRLTTESGHPLPRQTTPFLGK